LPILSLAHGRFRSNDSSVLFWTVVRVALRNLGASKMRSFLTILGVIIGVASVIAMLALGAGTRAKVTQSVRNYGANLLSVRPAWRPSTGAVRTGSYVTLKVADAEALLHQIPEIEMVSPDMDEDYQVKYMNRNAMVQVNGEAVTYFIMRNFPISDGRAFTEDEVDRAARVAVIGPKAAEKLFGSQDPVSEVIKIKGINFVVVGATKPKDDHADDNIWIPYTTAMNQIMGVNYVQQIYCRVRDGVDMNTAIDKITDVMRRQHRIQAGSPDDFTVRNNQAAADALNEVSTTFTMLLAGVAAISLLIGGINIMNIMLVTVTERTREIGLRKALGARRSDLLMQFLLEAVTISVTGGLIGVAIGIGCVVLFNRITEHFGGSAYGAEIKLLPVLISFGFSALVGIFFGWYPARKAAGLDPIDALRYE
jgi:putative ABC transport system permease protein